MYGFVKKIIIKIWNKQPPMAWYKLLTDSGKLFPIFFCHKVELVIAINATNDDKTPITGKFEPTSNPKTNAAPIKPSKAPVHCLKDTFSFKIGPAKTLVKTGCNVTINAVIPVGIPTEIEKNTPPK